MTSVFGTEPYEGLRYFESISTAYDPITSPTNYINARLPDDVLINETDTPAAAAALVKQVGNTYINTSKYSNSIEVVPADQPKVSVKLWRSSWTAVPTYYLTLASILKNEGAPIPEGWLPQGDSDSSGVFFQPDADRAWEMWRLFPATDPADLDAGYKYVCQAGGRMSYVSINPGHYVRRWNGATYPNLPTDPAKVATYEDNHWSVTAAALPLLELTITKEDVQAGVIAHAIRFACLPTYIAKGLRWPAQGYDGYVTGGPLQEGMRLRLPGGYQPDPTLHPIAQLIAVCARDYGIVLTDRAGALCFNATPDAEALFGGTPKSQILKGFPWGSLQVLATGSDVSPNPVPLV